MRKIWAENRAAWKIVYEDVMTDQCYCTPYIQPEICFACNKLAWFELRRGIDPAVEPAVEPRSAEVEEVEGEEEIIELNEPVQIRAGID
jgi:hypothetical protein